MCKFGIYLVSPLTEVDQLLKLTITTVFSLLFTVHDTGYKLLTICTAKCIPSEM
jgi:hypothetical protein